eukprot:g70284.t1
MGFAELKGHAFFRSINWDNLHHQEVPSVEPCINEALLYDKLVSGLPQKRTCLEKVLEFIPMKELPSLSRVCHYWRDHVVPRAFLKHGVF